MKTVVLTCDKNNWLLNGFYRQWNKYYPEVKPIACGYTRPENFAYDFYSLGAQENYPANKWSDALQRILQEVVGEEPVLIVLEDYWLTRSVNPTKIRMAEQFMLEHPEAIRFDLTTDRQYSSKYKYYEASYDTDIIEALPCEYYMSFQAAIWNPEHLYSILRPGETPWQTEILGSDRLASTKLKVYGTLQWLMRYQIMVRNGEFIKEGDWMYPPRQITDYDYRELDSMGFIPRLADNANENITTFAR